MIGNAVAPPLARALGESSSCCFVLPNNPPTSQLSPSSSSPNPSQAAACLWLQPGAPLLAAPSSAAMHPWTRCGSVLTQRPTDWGCRACSGRWRGAGRRCPPVRDHRGRRGRGGTRQCGTRAGSSGAQQREGGEGRGEVLPLSVGLLEGKAAPRQAGGRREAAHPPFARRGRCRGGRGPPRKGLLSRRRRQRRSHRPGRRWSDLAMRWKRPPCILGRNGKIALGDLSSSRVAMGRV